MKLFSHYLKDRRLFIVIYTFSLFTCYVVFKLYDFMCIVGGLFLLGLLQIL